MSSSFYNFLLYFMFWNNIKSLLKEKKITQKQFSVQLGLPERTIEIWIGRNTIPDAITSVKIAQSLGTTVEFLVTGIEPEITKQDVLNYLQNNLS